MINCIKEHQHPTLVNKIGTIEFADFLLIALGSTQFDIQTYNIYKYYRYNYFFTYVSDKIDMKKEYIVPMTEVSVFEAKDIITASLEMGETPGNQEIYSPIYWEDEISFGN